MPAAASAWGTDILMHDRDGKFTAGFDAVLTDAGLRGQQRMNYLCQPFVEHYHAERPHQGLDNELPAPPRKRRKTRLDVVLLSQIGCHTWLGGLLKLYYASSRGDQLSLDPVARRVARNQLAQLQHCDPRCFATRIGRLLAVALLSPRSILNTCIISSRC